MKKLVAMASALLFTTSLIPSNIAVPENHSNKMLVYADESEAVTYSLGDVTGDGVVDATDASFVLSSYAASSIGGDFEITDEQMQYADVNIDGVVDAVDASAILTYYAISSTSDVGTFAEYMNAQSSETEIVTTTLEVTPDVVTTLQDVNSSDDLNLEHVKEEKIEYDDNDLYFTKTENIYNVNDRRNVSDCFINSLGKITEQNGYSITHPIKLEDGKTYKWNALSLGTNNKVFHINLNGEIDYIDTADVQNNVWTYNCSRTGYVLLNLGQKSPNLFMVCENDLPDSYVKYELSLNNVSVDASLIKGEFDLSMFPFMSIKNMFNKDASIIGQWVHPATGIISKDEKMFVSDYIPIQNDVIYSVPQSSSFFGTSSKYVALYDSSKKYIGYATGTSNGKITSFETSNKNAKYIRFSGYNSQIDQIMVVQGEYPEKYVAYGYIINDEYLPSKTNETIIDKTLLNKKLALNGDSICFGVGYEGGYGRIIADKYSMTLSNIAVAGATIASGVKKDDGTYRHSISTSIDKMPDDYDYYILEGGVNDCALGIEIGKIVNGYPVKGENDTIDTATIIGGFEYACRELVTKYHDKKYGFIFVHGIFGNDSELSVRWKEIKEKMIQVLNKWGVPYLDLEKEVPPMNCIDTLKELYTHNGDGWHPNEQGYQNYYVPKIENWIKSL